MVSPIDYTIDVIDPFQRAIQGWQRGAQMTEQDNILAAQAAEAERKQQIFDQEQLRQKEMLAKRNEIITKGANLKDVQDFIFAYPEFSKPYEPILGNLKDTEKQDLFLLTRGAHNAMENDRPDIAKSEMERMAKAYENSGKQDWADSTRQFISAIDSNPKLVKYQLAGISTMLDPNAAKTIGDETRANELQPTVVKQAKANAAKTEAETGQVKAQTQGQIIDNKYKPQQYQAGIAQTNSQIALNYATINNMSERLGLDRDKLETETSLKLQELNPTNIKLSDGAQKIVNDNMIESVGLEHSANKMENLASRFEKESQAGGIYTKGWAGFKRITGWSNDDQNAMIREYSRIRNSEAIKSLPPGPATDKDIELALRGMPPETADSTTITSFLRGYAKLNRMDSAYKQMQAEWVNQVGNMGSTKRDVEVLGVKVPSGTTFSGFATKNLNKALKVQASQAVDRQIATGTRSYMSAVE